MVRISLGKFRLLLSLRNNSLEYLRKNLLIKINTMNIKTILAILTMAALPAFSASFSFNVDLNTGFATDADVALDSTYTAYFGTYTGGALSPAATFGLIDADFEILTSQAFSTGGVNGSDGYVILPLFSFTDADGFGGDPLYMFITDGGNRNALLTGFGNIPADADFPNTIAYFIDASNVAALTYTLGSYDAASPNLAGSGGNIILNNAVPEPSVALLGALGVLCLLRRRR